MANLRHLLDKLPIDDDLLRRLPVPGISGNVILEIDAARGVGEAAPSSPLEVMQQRNTPILAALVEGLRAAARDEKVVGLIAHTHGHRLSSVQADELREAVVHFRESGKPAVAWAESFGDLGPDLRHYTLATAFDEIWLQPTGELTLLGAAVSPTFLRGALDKLGVVPQFAGRKEYKSAGESLTETGFTEPNREQMQALIDSMVETAIQQIASARDLEVDAVREAFDQGLLTPHEAVERGLVDQVGYRDQAFASIRERVGDTESSTEVRFVERYGRADSSVTPKLPRIKRGLRTVALITASGNIHLGRAHGSGPSRRSIGSDDLGAALRLATSEKVDAVVVRVDSGGGSATASDAIRREMSRVREAGIPVVVSMGAAAASGGYYISMPATEIVASPYTLTGSIGVIAGKLVTEAAWQRLGITHDTVQNGRYAQWLSTRKEFDDDEWELLHRVLDRIYTEFVGAAAHDRGMEYEQMENLARGRIWTGRDAHARGLVDHLGGLDAAIDRVSVLLGVARAGLDVTPMPKVGPLDRFFPTDNTDAPVANTDAGLLSGERLTTDLVHGVTGALLEGVLTAFDLRGRGLLHAELPKLG